MKPEAHPDALVIAGTAYSSRLLVGTGKYKDFTETRAAIDASIDRAVQAFALLQAGEMEKAMVKIHTSKPPRPKPPKPAAATPPPDAA